MCPSDHGPSPSLASCRRSRSCGMRLLHGPSVPRRPPSTCCGTLYLPASMRTSSCCGARGASRPRHPRMMTRKCLFSWPPRVRSGAAARQPWSGRPGLARSMRQTRRIPSPCPRASRFRSRRSEARGNPQRRAGHRSVCAAAARSTTGRRAGLRRSPTCAALPPPEPPRPNALARWPCTGARAAPAPPVPDALPPAWGGTTRCAARSAMRAEADLAAAVAATR